MFAHFIDDQTLTHTQKAHGNGRRDDKRWHPSIIYLIAITADFHL